MNFTVERAALLDSVSRLQRVVGAKTSMPVLDGILLSAEQGKLTLIAYNLEMGMKKEIYANCSVPGDIVINAKLLADILRRLNGIQVEINCDEKLNCHIKCGEATFDIMGMAAIDFPEMPSVAEGKKLLLDGKLVESMVKGTIFAAAQGDDANPILTGIDVVIKNNEITLVAVDGYRLAIRKEKISSSDDFSFILTGKAFGEIIKLIDESTEDIEINVSTNLISLNINGYTFISRLLEGTFINFEKTIPSEHKQRVVMNTRELIETIERVSLLINNFASTPIRCYFNENTVVFTTITAMGKATECVNIDLDGESFEIGLNSRYLLEALKAIEAENIEILFKGATTGVVINEIDGDSFKYVIMPQRLK